MSTQEAAAVLDRLGRRLAAIAGEAHKTREQAYHILEQARRLRADVLRLRSTLASDVRRPPPGGG